MVGATFASFVALVAGVYRLGRPSFTPLVGVVAAALCHALRLPVPGRPRLHRHPVPRAGRLGGRARGRPAAARHARAACSSRSPGCCARRPGCWPACTASGAPGRRRGRSGSSYAALAAIGPVVWALIDFLVTGDPLFSLHPHDRLAEELGPHKGAGASARPRRGVPREPRQVAGLATARIVGLVLAIVLVAAAADDAARAARDRAWRRSCSSAPPACRSSTATCSSRR